jgi:hypothetical protein
MSLSTRAVMYRRRGKPNEWDGRAERNPSTDADAIRIAVPSPRERGEGGEVSQRKKNG